MKVVQAERWKRGPQAPPYNAEIYFDVAKTATLMGEHRSRPYEGRF